VTAMDSEKKVFVYGILGVMLLPVSLFGMYYALGGSWHGHGVSGMVLAVVVLLVALLSPWSFWKAIETAIKEGVV